ncbi:MAG TPA: hypothetical protein VF636_04740 [Sphingomonas sp.]|jgi:hypothetical protein
MTARVGDKRRDAFLRALAATGNQALAAERAKVSRSWVTKRRSEDPAFGEAMRQAVANAKARLDRASGVGPDGAWRAQAGEELAVRGSNGRWTQVARARLLQWTPRVEARFLAELAACCNVKRACAAVGLSPASAYGHRRRWQGFADRWDLAIEEGYDRLACALVANACSMLGDAELAPEPAVGPVATDDAIRLLRLHQRRAIGSGREPGRTPRLLSVDEAAPRIMAAFELAARAMRAEAERDQGPG